MKPLETRVTPLYTLVVVLCWYRLKTFTRGSEWCLDVLSYFRRLEKHPRSSILGHIGFLDPILA